MVRCKTASRGSTTKLFDIDVDVQVFENDIVDEDDEKKTAIPASTFPLKNTIIVSVKYRFPKLWRSKNLYMTSVIRTIGIISCSHLNHMDLNTPFAF